MSSLSFRSTSSTLAVVCAFAALCCLPAHGQEGALRFLQNRGQIHDGSGTPRPEILYIASAPGMRLFVSRTGISFVPFTIDFGSSATSLTEVPPLTPLTPSWPFGTHRSTIRGHRVDFLFVDALTDGAIEEHGESSDYINIYKGDVAPIERLRWCDSLVLRDLWRGVDLVLRSEGAGLKYDFVVRPEGNVGSIRLRYVGADAIELDESGGVRIGTSVGDLRDAPPIAYQGGRNEDSIVARYELRDGDLRLMVGEYDSDRPLIIDPQIVWSTYYGGSNNDLAAFPGISLGGAQVCRGLCLDSVRNVYITGTTTSIDFPVTVGAFQTTAGGSSGIQDAYVVSFTSLGTRRWATYLGGTSGDYASSINVGAGGIVLLTGHTTSTNFPVTSGAFQTSNGGSMDGYLARFDTTGQRVWCSYVGGSAIDICVEARVLPSGGLVVSGSTRSSNFPVTAGAFQSTFGGITDAFLMRFDLNGNRLWGTFIGTTVGDWNTGLSINRTGGVVLGFGTESTSFPTTAGTYRSTWTPGAIDAFEGVVMEFDTLGSRRWGSYFGGGAIDDITSIDVDALNRIYITGRTTSSNLPTTPSSLQPSLNTSPVFYDAFVARLSPTGGLDWCTYYGGSGAELPTSLFALPNGTSQIVGLSNSTDLIRSRSPFQGTFGGGSYDAFVLELDSSGSLLSDTYLGGNDQDWGAGLAADGTGSIYIYGITKSLNFPTRNAFQTSLNTTAGTLLDVFVARLCAGIVPRITTSDSTIICAGDSIILRAPPGFALYRWTPTNDTTQAIIVKNPGLYTVYVQDAVGCGESSEGVSVVVNPRPRPAIQVIGSLTLCQGDSVTLRAVATGVRSYRWSNGLTTQNIVVRTSGTYSVEVMDTNGCSGIAQPVTVQVNPVPTRGDIIGPDTVRICADSLATLQMRLPYYRVDWSNGSSGSLIRVGPGRYWGRVYNLYLCSNGSDTVVVERYPRSSVQITAHGPRLFCSGDSVLLDAGLGFTRYRWNTGDSTRTIWGRLAGAYTVTVTDTNGCMVTSDPIGLTEYAVPMPDVRIIGSPLLCQGDSVVLDAGAGLYKTYRWTTGDTVPRIVVRSSGWYSLQVTSFEGCVGNSTAINVNVVPRPPASIAGPEEICAATRGVYTAPSRPGLQYQWSLSNGGSFVGPTTNSTAMIAWGLGGSGRVTLTVTDPTTGCDSTTTLDVTIGTSLLPRITASRLTACPGDSVELDAGAGYAEYSWTTGETTRTIWAKPGTVYRVTVRNADGCSGTSVPLTIAATSNPEPIITPLGPTDLCEGSTMTLDAGAGFVGYEWSDGTTGRYLTVSRSGVYTVSVVDTNNCTGLSAPVTVTIHAPPHPQITGPSEVCRNGIAVYGTTLNVGSSYTWNVIGGTIQSGQGSEQITVLWGASGGGTVDVEERTSIGCSGRSDIFDVTVGSQLRPVITPSGPIGFCSGDSVIVDAGAGYASYLWSTGATTRRIIIRTAGSYNVAVTDSSGCGGRSDDVGVVEWSNPVPIVQPLGPIDFTDGDSVIIEVEADYSTYRWSDGRTTRRIAVKTSGTYGVDVTDSNGCRGVSAPITVTVTPKDPGTGPDTADVHVVVGRVSAGTGDEFTIPITITGTKIDPSGVTRLRGELRFNRTLMHPRGTTSSGTIEGNDRVVPIDIDLTTIGLEATIVDIEFVATLGNAERTPVRLENVEVTGGIARTTIEDGEFALTDLCREGGTRLVNADGDFGIKSVRPNPVSEVMLVEYEVVEDVRTEMVLIDATGREVRTMIDALLTKGRYRIGLDVRGLPTGSYRVVLGTTGTAGHQTRHAVPVRIVR